MIINLTPLGKPFYRLSNIQYSTDNGNNWYQFSDDSHSSNSYYETFYKNEGINNKGWLLVIKNNLKIRFTKPLKKMPTLYLVGGGGGGGCGDHSDSSKTANEGGGGGGQGGQVVTEEAPSLAANTEYNVSIGAGGSGSINHGNAGNGGETKFGNLTAKGGAAGGNSNINNGAGGVGGKTDDGTGGAYGGAGGNTNRNGSPGYDGELLTFDLFSNSNCGWSDKRYGSGGGGGPGGYFTDYTNTYGFSGIVDDGSGLTQQKGGKDSGGNGAVPVRGIGKSKPHPQTQGTGYYYYPISHDGQSLNSLINTSATSGENNFGGGGGGGGTFNFSTSRQKFLFALVNNKITVWDDKTYNSLLTEEQGGYLQTNTTSGANGGSGGCILYYKE